MTAHPGSFCAPAGSADATSAGTPMVCSVGDAGGRARWRSNGTGHAGRRAARRRLLAAAKRARVTVPRGLPDADVQALIAATQAAPPASTEPRTIGDRVRQAYGTLASRPGELVSLARLRDELPDVPRSSLDDVLLDLDRQRAIQLEPDPHRIALSDRAKAAAIRLGGEYMHLLTITPSANEIQR